MITRLLLALLASTFGVSCYYDAPPYPGATYQSYGSNYQTRSGYSDPWADGGIDAFRVGYRDPYPYSHRSAVGYHHRYNHGPSCGCSSCRNRYHHNRGHGGHPSHRKTDSRSHSKSKSSSSKKKSSSSSSRSKSSSSSRPKPSSSRSSSSSKGDRAKEWQKSKGGNPRAKR